MNGFTHLLITALLIGGAANAQISTPSPSLDLDLLVVVDNSPSMRQERENLGQRLSQLVSFTAHLNWRIAVTTTDKKDACVKAVIDKSDENASEKFLQAVTVGTSGSFKEQGVLKAVEGLKAKCLAESWLRPGSTIAVLIVSDEDNCSHNAIHCQNKPWASAAFLTDYLKSLRPEGGFKIFGLIWHPDLPRENCPTAYNPAPVYADLISTTGGLWSSICENDFSRALTGFSRAMNPL